MDIESRKAAQAAAHMFAMLSDLLAQVGAEYATSEQPIPGNVRVSTEAMEKIKVVHESLSRYLAIPVKAVGERGVN